MEQRSEEWFAARKGRITASSVGAILGLSPHITRDDVMRRMVREAVGAEKEFKGNIATEYGEFNEPGALLDFQLDIGMPVELCGLIAFEDWAGASPDGLIGKNAILEIKCPFGKRKDDKPEFKLLKDQPHYYAQVQFQLLCTDRNLAYFYQWSAKGAMLDMASVDHTWRDENLPKLRQFYAEYLDAVKEPSEYLNPRRVVVDTPEASRMLREWDELTEAIDNATERKKVILADLARIAGQSNAEICGRKLTLVQKDGAVSYAKALAELAPGADLEKWRGQKSSFWQLR